MILSLQAILLNSRGSPWSVCWFDVQSLPLVIPRTGSGANISALEGTRLPTPPAKESAEDEGVAIGSGVDIS